MQGMIMLLRIWNFSSKCCLYAILIVLAGCSEPTDPAEALHSLEAHPFRNDVLLDAVDSLNRAVEKHPDDPWIYLGLAKANLINGYRSGNRFDGDNFDPESVENANLLVEHAIKLDSSISRAHAMQARLQIIGGEYEKAWKTLNRAHELDKKSFYPWYLMGVLNRYYREYDQSGRMLDRAWNHASRKYQKRWILDQRQELAERRNDPVAEEKIHKQVISIFPERAHGYGNYGAFLLEQERYEEAIAQYEKALSITRYPLAEKQLEKARRKLASGN